ncbi:type IA DNA topoisomerase [Caldinitratiruptor microaerophilus]|uniref:DNA topoisomerase n=1 Tax=Caldinitratiruptor microaerophilus TaxID=671077 RepID=A0AA35CMR6_9FIRM|nr:type IA DNA topoisomerase [Caldinitratiruptor microaerophilus]BDG60432.1 hypothetical protein caldi_15220 [Caldinitratiruptor microaerophilus]
MPEKKPLIIAEKPSAAWAIAQALGGFRSAGSYMESPDFLLSWALGHLVELAEPEEYEARWRRWSLDTLPILPSEWRLKVADKTRSQFQVLARLSARASELVNACDAGREGELIFRYIASLLPHRLPVRRLWVSSLTREAIRKGFQDLRPAEEYDRLYESALCRARGDWLVGMNASRAFTTAFGELFSVGRVQTPTLALLVRREREIRAFRPEPYWEVYATFRTPGGEVYAGKWSGPDGDRLRSAEEAESIRQRVLAAGTGTVEEAEEKDVPQKPPPLFDLTSLQREANRRWGMTAAATLRAAQELYEARLITYPRTDSRYLTRDVARTLGRVVAALSAVPAYAPLAAGGDLQRIWTGRVVNEARVTDHHAIIPTGEAVPALSGAAARVFDLVARRLLAQLYPDAVYREGRVVTAAGPDRFVTRGRRLVDPGWRLADPDAPGLPPPAGDAGAGPAADAGDPGPATGPGPAGDGADAPAARSRRRGRTSAAPQDAAAEPPPLPRVSPGDPVRVEAAESVRKETQPPRRYTEATLLAAMEGAGRELEDEALREAMKGHGLGTPATRAAIIERLKEVGYVRARGKVLFPTEKGERLVDLAEHVQAAVLLSAELTGEWEKRIADIQAGTYEPARLLDEMRDLAVGVVERVRRAVRGGSSPTRRAGDANTAAREADPAGSSPARAARGTRRPPAQATPIPGELPAAPGLVAGSCPRCGGPVRRDGRDWRCAGGCGLRVPGFLCGRPIGPDVAGVILREGRTPLLTGFRSRGGKPFDAYLVLDGAEVRFEFPPSRRDRGPARPAARKRARPPGGA